MQTENENIINLFEKRSIKPRNAEVKKEDEASCEGDAQVDHSSSFAEVMRKNAANKERERQERLKANKSVLRSYRLNSKK